ncbi:MAG: transglycosylase domain-containing protein [Prevotellaceae bacterium]|jgi:penicillin-binding protein 1A|nr:transglycosylase domain-containing protein [Prevotellaceae bacterium]
MLKIKIREWLLARYQQFKLWRKKRKASFKAAPLHKKIIRIGLTAVLFFFVYLFLVDINFLWLFGKSPGLASISKPQQSIASEIYSADEKQIGKFFRENRTPVKYEEINPIMIKTLVATEDERFYEHYGVDFQGVFAALKDYAAHGRARGASTISQQLVKNMFKTRSEYSTGLFGYIPGVKMLIMKTKEWIVASKIELFYTKEEILTMYLNTVDFGSNAYGIKTASKTYFNTTPKELTVEQAATLVGLLKATTTYNPKINPQNSLRRRNVVLENLEKHSIISQAEYDSLKTIPINLTGYKVEQNYDGQGLYFREAVAEWVKQWCKDQEKEEYKDLDIYSDGLKIYTTLDTRMQRYAEDAVRKQMSIVQRQFNNHWGREEPWRDEQQQIIPNFVEDLARKTSEYKNLSKKYDQTPDSVWVYLNIPRKMKVFDYKTGQRDTALSTMDSIRYMTRFLHSGFVAVEPETGYIKAWVGDIDFRFWKYDKVTSERQPGSTFKLFVYASAFEQGLGPCDEITDEYTVWEYLEKGETKRWVPRNASGEYSGDTMTLKYAFARSINTAAVKIAQRAGIGNIIRTAQAMGITTELHNTPSLSLGSSDVQLIDLVNSYCTVVNEGKRQTPVLVSKIVDKNGKTIYRHKPQTTQAISYETAFLMIQMLRGGLSEPMGTSQALWAFDLFRSGTDFGGKTGTSSNHSDAWYVGVTPRLVAGAWVGGEYRSIHFRTGKLGEGSKTALPIFGYFMEKVLADEALSQYRAKFPVKPKHSIARPYDCHTPYPVVPDSIDESETDSVVSNELTTNNCERKYFKRTQ